MFSRAFWQQRMGAGRGPTFSTASWVFPDHAEASAGRVLLWFQWSEESLSSASQLCMLSVKDVCKMGLLSILFNFSMGPVFVKASWQLTQKEMPQNFLGKGKKIYFRHLVSC